MKLHEMLITQLKDIYSRLTNILKDLNAVFETETSNHTDSLIFKLVEEYEELQELIEVIVSNKISSTLTLDQVFINDLYIYKNLKYPSENIPDTHEDILSLNKAIDTLLAIDQTIKQDQSETSKYKQDSNSKTFMTLFGDKPERNFPEQIVNRKISSGDINFPENRPTKKQKPLEVEDILAEIQYLKESIEYAASEEQVQEVRNIINELENQAAKLQSNNLPSHRRF